MEDETELSDEDEIHLAYKEMYEQLSKEKKGYKEQLQAVIISSVSLEWSINQLVTTVVSKLPSDGLEEWARNANVSIHYKLKALRFANVISEELYRNLVILFKIRNRFAHDMPLPPKALEAEFELLKDIGIDSEFVRNLSNDHMKFQIVMSRCFVELMQVSKRLDPSSVMHLELVGDITPVEE
jgi:hypothetical protein